MTKQNIEGIIHEREQFGEDPIERARSFLLPKDFTFQTSWRDKIPASNPVYIKELQGSIKYCAQMYANQDAQWQIIQEDIAKLEQSDPLGASRYYDVFGKANDAIRAKTVFLEEHTERTFQQWQQRMDKKCREAIRYEIDNLTSEDCSAKDASRKISMRYAHEIETSPEISLRKDSRGDFCLSEGLSRFDWSIFKNNVSGIVQAYNLLQNQGKVSDVILRYNALCSMPPYREVTVGLDLVGGIGGEVIGGSFHKYVNKVNPEDFKISGPEKRYIWLSQKLNLAKIPPEEVHNWIEKDNPRSRF